MVYISEYALDEKSNLVAFQANLIPMYNDSSNVTTCPMKIVISYPMVVYSLYIPAHQKPLHTRQNYCTNPINVCYNSFSNCVRFPVVAGYFWHKVNFRKCK